MQESVLIEKSMDFSVSVLKMTESIKGHYALINQLEKSATSIGANIHEAGYAQSKADFITKMQIALKETGETEYWIELLMETGYITEEAGNSLISDCKELIKIITSILRTAKI